MTTFYADKENLFNNRLFIEWLSCARFYAKLPKYKYDLDKLLEAYLQVKGWRLIMDK